MVTHTPTSTDDSKSKVLVHAEVFLCVYVCDTFHFFLSTEIFAPTYVQDEAALFQAAKVGDAAAVKRLIFEVQVNVNSAHEVCTKCIMCSIFIVV